MKGSMADAFVCVGVAYERQLNLSGQQPLEDVAGRRDFDLDGDVRVVALEAAERVGQQVDTGRRGADVDRSELEAGKSLQLLLASAEGLERLSRVECEDGARFGETAAASVAFDEALPRG